MATCFGGHMVASSRYVSLDSRTPPGLSRTPSISRRLSRFSGLFRAHHPYPCYPCYPCYRQQTGFSRENYTARPGSWYSRHNKAWPISLTTASRFLIVAINLDAIPREKAREKGREKAHAKSCRSDLCASDRTVTYSRLNSEEWLSNRLTPSAPAASPRNESPRLVSLG